MLKRLLVAGAMAASTLVISSPITSQPANATTDSPCTAIAQTAVTTSGAAAKCRWQQRKGKYCKYCYRQGQWRQESCKNMKTKPEHMKSEYKKREHMKSEYKKPEHMKSEYKEKTEHKKPQSHM
ncbi:hypothetical protein ACFOY2_47770 [Nonomuraea purpurea]|uniref:Uncharacterized protein n=1 Tax=Nonomuraea purpurea TaxID=1849276 RepID=A0ABV8GQC1_9ACTN